MHLNREFFLQVIAATPFVSIDLIIRNEKQQVLLGYRKNRPAQHHWFVPGGRIRKNELLQHALERVARAELGIAPRAGNLIGVFEHFYDDNYYGVADISTHYVVCTYQFSVSSQTEFIPDDQHSELKWWSIEDLLASTEVHDNTKLYFRDPQGHGLTCV